MQTALTIDGLYTVGGNLVMIQVWH